MFVTNYMNKIILSSFLYYSRKIKGHFIIIFFIILSVILVQAWFSHHNLIATGEEGLMFYNPQILLSKFGSSWIDTGLGAPNPGFIPRIPFFWLLSALNSLFPSWISELIVFATLLSVGGIGTYYLGSKYIWSNRMSNFIAANFYILNLYTQTQIFNRFLTPSMFAWSFLPWFIYLWLNWIKIGKLKQIIYFVLCCLLFSNMYSSPANVITMWLPAAILSLSLFKKSEWKVYLFRFTLGIFLWLLANLWWLYPIITIGSDTFSEVFTLKYNIDSLSSVSSQFDWWHYLVFYHWLYMSPTGPWGILYTLPHRIFISFIPLFFLPVGLIKTPRSNIKYFLIILLLLSWFIIKGTNPPLGTRFYTLLFSASSLFEVFRNPFEKFGIVWLLIYSFFFGAGLSWFIAKNSNTLKKIIGYTSMFIVFYIVVKPMWNGQIYQVNTKVTVPSYYTNLNEFLKNTKNDSRVVLLPLIGGDSVKYNWGYQGIDASDVLIQKESLSRVLPQTLADVERSKFKVSFNSGKDFRKELEDMNIEYLLVQNDLDYVTSDASSSASVSKRLISSALQKVTSIGPIDIYKYEQTNPGLFVIENGEKSVVSYTKLSNTHYRVYVKNANSEAILVFRETYHKNWHATLNDKLISDHYIWEGYGNSWKLHNSGDYAVEVTFPTMPWNHL